LSQFLTIWLISIDCWILWLWIEGFQIYLSDCLLVINLLIIVLLPTCLQDDIQYLLFFCAVKLIWWLVYILYQSPVGLFCKCVASNVTFIFSLPHIIYFLSGHTLFIFSVATHYLFSQWPRIIYFLSGHTLFIISVATHFYIGHTFLHLNDDLCL